MMMAKLKECPFCGNELDIFQDEDTEYFGINCLNHNCVLHHGIANITKNKDDLPKLCNNRYLKPFTFNGINTDNNGNIQSIMIEGVTYAKS